MLKKKLGSVIAFLSAAAMLFSAVFSAKAEEIESISVSAQNAIVMTADSKEIIFEKNSGEKRPMASTTKIMTALLALEEIERAGNPVVEITADMVPVEGSSMGLQAGDMLGLEGIVGGMMMTSGNDAANVIAVYLGGSQEGFAELMNNRAKEIGMADTSFVTASGLDDEAHYSTAYDMALLGIQAMKNKKFREIVKSESIPVSFEFPEKTQNYKNHNKLLGMYEGCIGIKTGFTKKSGRCLVSAAEKDGIELVAVTLNAPNDWDDHSNMLDYGFSKLRRLEFDEREFFESVPVVGGDKDTLKVCGVYGGVVTTQLETVDALNRIVKLPKFVYAEIEKGEIIGRIEYYSQGQYIYSLPVKAAEDINMAKKLGLFKKLFRRGE